MSVGMGVHGGASSFCTGDAPRRRSLHPVFPGRERVRGGPWQNAVMTRPDPVVALAEEYPRFLGFLAKRTGDRAAAEEILQEAFARAVTKAHGLRDDSSAVAWFYQVLRNALVDHARRAASEGRALAAYAAEQGGEARDEELEREVCRCVARIAGDLKPEYSDALRGVEVDGLSLKEFAAAAGITPNNAAVRVHRAREALRKRLVATCATCAAKGCSDCTCGPRDEAP